MRRNIRLALVVATALAGTSLAAQSTAVRKGWTPPRTPDGQPDLQAVWTNATITPFERPASLRDKAFLTEAEAEAIERQQATTRRDEDAAHLARHRPGGRPRAAPSRGGSGARLQQRARTRFVRVHERVGSLHHAWRAGRHVPCRIQQRVPDRPDARLRGDPLRDDPRRADHPDRRSPACAGDRAAVERRPARPLGR